MKAVFVQRDTILRDSHLEPTSLPSAWRLSPATIESLRALGNSERLVIMYGAAPGAHEGQERAPGEAETNQAIVRQVEAGGGRIDGVAICPHEEEAACSCWGEHPRLLWLAAAQFNLRLEECYVLADGERDLLSAHAAGARPLLVLCSRTIGEILGDQPPIKGFPAATDLTMATSYIGVEDDIAQQLGHSRGPAVSPPAEEVLYAPSDAMPLIVATSTLGQHQLARVRRSRAQLRDVARWMSFLVLGAVGLSLGIAYMLTHFYRMQPFPEFAYYLTLQFIPRPLRGGLFILWGLGVIALAVRSLYRSSLWDLVRRNPRGG